MGPKSFYDCDVKEQAKFINEADLERVTQLIYGSWDEENKACRHVPYDMVYNVSKMIKDWAKIVSEK